MASRFRRRDDMNEYIFSRLLDFVSDYERPIPSGKRWVDLTSQDKKDCINIVIEEIFPIAPGVITSFFSIGENKYFVMTGYDEVDMSFDDELYLREVDITAGIFLKLVCELRIPIKRQSSKSEIYNGILFQQEEESYTGHDYKDLAPFFQNIKLYEFNPNSIFLGYNLGNMVGYLFSNNVDLLPLHLPENVLNHYSRLFVKDIDSINYNMLTKSLISVQWKDVFIEIYRCIESIFHSYSLKDLYNSFRSSLPIEDFSILMEEKLKVRPKEEDSLITIFEGIDQNTTSLIESVKPSNLREVKEARWFYKIRNNIVHSRPINEEVDFEDEEWGILILASLQVLEQSHELIK